MKIYKHFSHTTPFSMAENEQELAEIMRLKYPKACSNLETGAGFFYRMVKEVQQFEAWRVIGFASFEDFCRDELGKTLREVEEIVHGVELLGGDPTEADAKKASRSAQAAQLVKAGTHTQAEAARHCGVTKQAVSKAISQPARVIAPRRLTPKPPMIRLALDAVKTADNIRAKMGDEYAARLKEAL
jgi:hypothetical protein